jgi:dipeptidyl aminopeptidase/acylaminoacyl peptidase
MRILTRHLTLLCALIATLGNGQTPANKKVDFTLEQALTLPTWTLQGLTRSPDGKQIAFAVTEPPKEAVEGGTHIWTYSPVSHELRELTHSNRTETQPQWSPDSRQLAFISNRDGDFKQIYVMPADGGEAMRLTDGKRSINNFAWSPNGKQIAFVAPEPKTEEEERKEREKDDAWVVGRDAMGFTPGEKQGRLWLVDVPSGTTRQLVGAPWHFTEIHWPASTHRLIAVATDTPVWDRETYRIFGVNLAGKMQEIAAPQGRFGGLSISPDGKYVSYIGPRVDGPSPHDLYIRAIDGEEKVNLTAKSIDRPVGFAAYARTALPGYQWLSNRELAVLVDDGFHSKLYDVSTDGRALLLASPDMMAESVSLWGRASGVLIAENATHPAELWEWNGGSALNRISRFNAYFDGVALHKAQFIHYKSFDGRQIEAMLLAPSQAAGGAKVPAVIFVHGGPDQAFQDKFNPLGQVLATRGYATLYPNVHGSMGYGFEFLASNRGDWGDGDFKDVMAGADYLVETGIADPNRLGIGGASYGGYMAMWAITQTSRFKVAVAGYGLSDLATEFGTEAQQINAYDEWFNGTPYENGDVYRKSSPITYIRDVVKYGRTPTLITQGDQDPIDPMSQSQIWYRGLRRYGVETEMVIYPREGHGISEVLHRKDYMKRETAWYDKYLK